MTKTIASQPETKAQLPVPKEPVTVTVKGQKYQILRFEGKGPNLAQTIAIVESMQGKQMLTLKEAREIIHDRGELNTAFRKALKPCEWGYVRDPESEARSFGAYLNYGSVRGGLHAYDNSKPTDASIVVILKVTSGAPAAQEIADRLRKE